VFAADHQRLAVIDQLVAASTPVSEAGSDWGGCPCPPRHAPASPGLTGCPDLPPGGNVWGMDDGMDHDSRDDDRRGRISVRWARSGDWLALRQVRLAALTDAPSAFGSTLEHELALSEEEWRERTGQAAWFLAWRPGAPGRSGGPGRPAEQSAGPVGLAAAFPQQPRGRDRTELPGTGPVPGWHLISMWASPQVRGSGVAGLLVDAVAAHAKGAGAERVTLWVADGNDRARGFYRRAGFRPTGRRQTYRRRDGSALDEHELVLELAELAREL
jgi:ribosomal protein S18 acetylase RimI-like enzyme